MNKHFAFDVLTHEAMLDELAGSMVLGALLTRLRGLGEVTLLDHWKQGEFHHDVVLRVDDVDLPGSILVVSTNCNGGIKEVLCFDDVPERWALWNHRCPDNPEFEGSIPSVLGLSRTHHYFDPCDLLKPDARSELRPEFRRRQRGGGWEPTY